MRLAIVDSRIANLSSVNQSFVSLGVQPSVAKSPADLDGVDAVVLPGVGSFAVGMHELSIRGFPDTLRSLQSDGCWILGICLGMQLLMDSGTEGGYHEGIGLIPGTVRDLHEFDSQPRLPNIGWRRVTWSQNSLLASTDGVSEYFYFMHSFAVVTSDAAAIAGDIHFGDAKAPAAVQAGRTLGVQFHPEKSQMAGLRILRQFCDLVETGERP